MVNFVNSKCKRSLLRSLIEIQLFLAIFEYFYAYIIVLVDVQIGGIAAASVMIKATACCGYGVAGVRIAASQAGYDCLMIPGATKAAFDGEVPVSQCGRNLGLASGTAVAAGATNGITICSK